MLHVLVIHNEYQQYGGEDAVFAAEVDLLRSRGHTVTVYTRHNDEVRAMNKVQAGLTTIWSRSSSAAISDILETERPDVVHFHNFFPLVSPAAHIACKRHGVPVVQTLHNYRLLCPNGLFHRDGAVCEDCLGRRLAWPGVKHACYRDSRTASATVAAMLATHRVLGTWSKAVTTYIALTEFAKQKFIQGGLDPSRIVVKPHFVDPDPGPGSHEGGYYLFVGRLSHEKGLATLLDAWRSMGDGVPLKIVGDGPMAAEVEQAASEHAGIEWLGWQSPTDVLDLMGHAYALVVPSVWYETFGRIVMEAYSRGTPVICSNIGAIAELVREGETGYLFEPGNTSDLESVVRRLWDQPKSVATMGQQARVTFESNYSASANYDQLLQIYQQAISTPVR